LLCLAIWQRCEAFRVLRRRCRSRASSHGSGRFSFGHGPRRRSTISNDAKHIIAFRFIQINCGALSLTFFLSLFIEEVQRSQGRHFPPSLSLFLSITAISNGSVESTLLSLLYCILSSTKSSFFVTLLIVEYHHTTFFASATG